jgi:hypothetical protein
LPAPSLSEYTIFGKREEDSWDLRKATKVVDSKKPTIKFHDERSQIISKHLFVGKNKIEFY